jgi:hypothetical protein
MHADQFEIRLARVRHRFATTLEGKIRDAVVSADHMTRGQAGVIKHVSASYRDLHSICGIGPSVGFAATGEAALAAEGALLQAHREQRGLTDREIICLKRALEHLRVAAASELRLMYQRGGGRESPSSCGERESRLSFKLNQRRPGRLHGNVYR